MLPGRSDWESHYDPWKYANDCLADGALEQARTSAIFQLRRAVEFREKELKSIYSFDKIPGFEGTKDHKISKILLDLQIFLPIMRKQLIDFRNAVSHDPAKKPPDLNRCRKLAEFTWYFLKSTDHLLSVLLELWPLTAST